MLGLGKADDGMIHFSDEAVTFESVKFPGQRIGILPNGEVKPPENTGRGQHGQFVPKVVGELSVWRQ